MQNMIPIIKYLVNLVVAFFSILIFIDTLMSYFIHENSSVRRILAKILTPIYQPIRRIIPPLAGIDFTPLIAIILLQVLDMIIISLLSLL
ncbi:MAG: YggT family protein [Anaerolineaceae bacterium]|nr:YggT family protein [Anaerolineaceae bacterium]MBN2676733.1 YggT family protein [Anaerolineaceae bacterium]